MIYICIYIYIYIYIIYEGFAAAAIPLSIGDWSKKQLSSKTGVSSNGNRMLGNI